MRSVTDRKDDERVLSVEATEDLKHFTIKIAQSYGSVEGEIVLSLPDALAFASGLLDEIREVLCPPVLAPTPER